MFVSVLVRYTDASESLSAVFSLGVIKQVFSLGVIKQVFSLGVTKQVSLGVKAGFLSRCDKTGSLSLSV